MPNIFHQSVEDILKAATPEQRLLWNYIFLRWGERVPIAQLFFQGSSVGTEFLTYSARKLYIFYELELGGLTGFGAATPNVSLYDETNNVFYGGRQMISVWDATAATVTSAPTPIKFINSYFSRVSFTTYGYLKFIGYRIAI